MRQHHPKIGGEGLAEMGVVGPAGQVARLSGEHGPQHVVVAAFIGVAGLCALGGGVVLYEEDIQCRAGIEILEERPCLTIHGGGQLPFLRDEAGRECHKSGSLCDHVEIGAEHFCRSGADHKGGCFGEKGATVEHNIWIACNAKLEVGFAGFQRELVIAVAYVMGNPCHVVAGIDHLFQQIVHWRTIDAGKRGEMLEEQHPVVTGRVGVERGAERVVIDFLVCADRMKGELHKMLPFVETV